MAEVVGSYLLRRLKEWGIRRVYGYPGDGINGIMWAFHHGGFVRRYDARPDVDGLPPGEGVFLPCSFWLADCYALLGREADARGLLERVLALRKDVGLLSEEYDPSAARLVGNFPQAFTHVALANTARNLTKRGGPAEHRRDG